MLGAALIGIVGLTLFLLSRGGSDRKAAEDTIFDVLADGTRVFKPGPAATLLDLLRRTGFGVTGGVPTQIQLTPLQVDGASAESWARGVNTSSGGNFGSTVLATRGIFGGAVQFLRATQNAAEIRELCGESGGWAVFAWPNEVATGAFGGARLPQNPTPPMVTVPGGIPGLPGITVPSIPVPTIPGYVGPGLAIPGFTMPGNVPPPGNLPPPAPSDGLDPHLPDPPRSGILALLARPDSDPTLDPFMLEALARALDTGGFPLASGRVAAKASAVRAWRAAHGNKVPPPPPIPVPPPGPPVNPPPIPPTGVPVLPTWTVRQGDIPYIMAQRMAGDGSRWREILSVNPTFTTKTVQGMTQIDPWYPGLKINLPMSWDVSKGGNPLATPAKPATPEPVDNGGEGGGEEWYASHGGPGNKPPAGGSGGAGGAGGAGGGEGGLPIDWPLA